MDFEDLMHLSRESYVSQFSSFVEAQSQKLPNGAPEVKLQVSGQSSFYGRFYCADYGTGEDDGEIVELTPDEEVSFEPVVVSLGGLEMRVERLSWHDVNLELTGQMMTPDRFGDWFETWFDPYDRKPDWDSKFSSHVHSLMIDGQDIRVDLGTAPVEALVDLFVLIEEAGVKALTLS